MGVFDGSTYMVSSRRKGGGEDDEYTDSPRALMEQLRADPDIAAVETRWVHYVIGEREDDLCFGNFWGDDEEEEDDE